MPPLPSLSSPAVVKERAVAPFLLQYLQLCSKVSVNLAPRYLAGMTRLQEPDVTEPLLVCQGTHTHAQEP